MKNVKIRRFKNRLNYNLSRIKLFKYIIIIFLIFLFVSGLLVYENTFKPQVKSLAKSKAYYLLNIAINKGVSDVIEKNKLCYDDLVTFIKDDSGNITGIMTNLMAVNRLKTEFTLAINEKIENTKKTEIYIPIGNLTGMEIFSGLGPRFKIELIPSAATIVDFKNSFTEAGINQTRHEIFLVVDSEISMLMPNSLSVSTKVSNKIPIAESIIVGKVPDTLTRVETKEEDIRDDIMNLN